MRIALSWLKELVDIDLTPEALAEALSNAGFEVESIEYQDRYLKKVVVAEIIAIEPHPNADKLRITRARTPNELQIVTAATNIKVGDKVPLALIGAILEEDFEIKKAKLRGVESFGMYCSEKELGLAKESKGVLVLPADAPVGMEIAHYLDRNDVILDITSTANRGDCLSYLGIAREVAAITNKSLKKTDAMEEKVGDAAVSPSIQIAHPLAAGCLFYLGRVIEGVKVQQSPPWLQKRLINSGMRPVNNLVDITNYVMLETGQPMHAFDLSELQGKLSIRPAQEGERLKTLDGVDRMLNSQDMVIADDTGPLALAGIMGGERGEVKASTTRIFLESAYFAPIAVRKASKNHGLRTEASQRFERGVDPQGVRQALYLATRLMMELAEGKTFSPVLMIGKEDFEATQITLRLSRLNSLLGTQLSMAEVEAILRRLEFRVSATNNVLQVTVPSFRQGDVTREVDLVEEVGRILGYQNIPSALPLGWAKSQVPSEKEYQNLIRKELIGAGLQEVITYSLVSQSLYRKWSPHCDMRELIPVANPLTEDYTHLRNSILPSLLEVIQKNHNRQIKDIHIFEIGKIFTLQDGSYQEHLRVGGALTGRFLLSWSQNSYVMDFYIAKGILEKLFQRLGLEGVRYLPETGDHHFHLGRSARIVYRGENLGILGEADPRLLQRFDLTSKVYLFDLDFNALLESSQLIRTYRPLAQFPKVSRDIAFLVDETIPQEAIATRILQEGGKFLEEVLLFDYYKGEPVPAGQKSLAYALCFRSSEKTLTDEEVNSAIEKILFSLKNAFNVQLRS